MNTTTTAAPAIFWVFFIGYFLFILAVSVAMIAGTWKTFSKAGQPGWAAIIPIYNIYIMTQIARRPGWWTALCFVPLLGILIMVIMSLDIADAFGKSIAFGIGLALLGQVFYCILGFGKAEFRGTDDHATMTLGDSFTTMGQYSSTPRTATPPPGWYQAPDGSGTRWWDGRAWGPPPPPA